jgi:hypothetical protein
MRGGVRTIERRIPSTQAPQPECAEPTKIQDFPENDFSLGISRLEKRNVVVSSGFHESLMITR